MAATHRILSLRCRLRTLSVSAASPLQQRCSVLVAQRLQATLEEVLDRFESQLQGPLVIDRLVMDIGAMLPEEFDSQFVQRVALQLERQLRFLLEAAPRAAAGETLVCLDGQFTLQATADQEQAATPPTEDDAATQLERYLLTGYWPHAPGWQSAQARDAWLRQEWAQAPPAMRAALARACLQRQALARLVHGFSATALESVTSELSGETGYLAQGVDLPLAARLYLSAVRFHQRHPGPAWPGAQAALAACAGKPPQALRALLEETAPWAIDPVGKGAAPVAPLPASPVLPEMAVCNAGVVLLWPLLPGLFASLGLVKKTGEGAQARQDFANAQAQHIAACWLDALIWDDGAAAEWRAPLNKLICGLPLDHPLLPWPAPGERIAAQLREWLARLPAQLPGLQRCSVADLRTLFLQRPGRLLQVQSHWELEVQADASDLLLEPTPWPMGN